MQLDPSEVVEVAEAPATQPGFPNDPDYKYQWHLDQIGMPEAWKEKAVDAVPLGRFGTSEEVAAAIAFLCTDAAAYVTGALLPVDGGLGMGH